ncbi:hypothetical protein AMTRI_Chr08g167740 [Amborella trichopoda]
MGVESEREVLEPLSPITLSLSTPKLTLYIISVFESEIPFNVDTLKSWITQIMDCLNPRFCCTMVEKDRGELRWKRVNLNIDDHFIVPKPPNGDSDTHDQHVKQYICDVSLKPLPMDRPLWEFHVLNWKTTCSPATLVVKVHHSVGDGVSMMSFLLDLAKRADDPTKPISFPTSSSASGKAQFKNFRNVFSSVSSRIGGLVSGAWYSAIDVVDGLARSKLWVQDSNIPMRGPPGVEKLPVRISQATMDLKEIKMVGKKLNATVNDVLLGAISYGLQKYLQLSLSKDERYKDPSVILEGLNVTSLVFFNAREDKGLQKPEMMFTSNSKAPWGNRIYFFLLPIPFGMPKDPTYFVKQASSSTKRSKSSLGVLLGRKFLVFKARYRDPEVAASSFYNSMSSTTLALSNMVGPKEKIAIEGHPIKDFSFFVTGIPLSLFLSVVSYMDHVNLRATGTKGYVDTETLCRCITEAFQEIKDSLVS